MSIVAVVAVAVVVAVVYLHDITTYINIREISQMNHANKDLKEVKNLIANLSKTQNMYHANNSNQLKMQ